MSPRPSTLPVYIVNLERSPERWIRTFRALSRIVNPDRIHRVPAVDGRVLARQTGGEDAGNRPGKPGEWDPGQLQILRKQGYLGELHAPDPTRVAVALSHLRACRQFLASQAPWGLIVEDDVRVLPEWALMEGRDVLPVPGDAELVFLHDRMRGRGAIDEDSPDGGRWTAARQGIGLEAYLVTQRGARLLERAFRPLVAECDLQLVASFPGAVDLAWVKKINDLRADNHAPPAPRIQAYCARTPLFQTDPGVPSIKLGVIEEIKQAHHDGHGMSRGQPRERAVVRLDPARGLGLAACYFNPVGYQSRLSNAIEFLQGMEPFRNQLLVVELAFGDDPWELPDNTPNLIRLRSRSICWQKEALLNAAMGRLADAGFPYVGWLDADVRFPDLDWPERACDLVGDKHLIQLFSQVERSAPDIGTRRVLGASRDWVGRGGTPWDGHATGFGWAMRREVWEAARLYDSQIVGGADWCMWRGVFMNYVDRKVVLRGYEECALEGVRATFEQWAGRWSRAVQMKVGYLEDTVITALPHGRMADRAYDKRKSIMMDHGFDPRHHVTRDEAGLLQWTESCPPALISDVRGYFFARDEDLEGALAPQG